TEVNRFDIHRIISRIKAEEEIWNKVVDEIFDLDSIVTRDKELKHLSRYVKDIFGIKIVVGEADNVYHVQDTLEALRWADPVLAAFKVEPGKNTQALEFIERKNYLAGGNRKASGWRAYKSVVRWWDRTFEIQIQPLRNFLRERELLTLESHMSFKANRDRVRSQVAQQIPLFGYCQELLRWLFLNPDGAPPVRENIEIIITE
ncbi:MAG: hypothetical protein R3264_20825, partial [Anaerolineae bacterium]|nr:hypothetical protein [Anaerolineae bacterium]